VVFLESLYAAYEKGLIFRRATSPVAVPRYGREGGSSYQEDFTVKIDTLGTLFEEELKDIYDAEKRLVKAIPKMAKAASSAELRQALEEHLAVTKGHVQRLEQVNFSEFPPRPSPA